MTKHVSIESNTTNSNTNLDEARSVWRALHEFDIREDQTNQFFQTCAHSSDRHDDDERDLKDVDRQLGRATFHLLVWIERLARNVARLCCHRRCGRFRRTFLSFRSVRVVVVVVVVVVSVVSVARSVVGFAFAARRLL
jgi:hypothetical protein